MAGFRTHLLNLRRIIERTVLNHWRRNDTASPYGIGFFGEKIFVTNTQSGIISEYSKAGKLINDSFISGLGNTLLWSVAAARQKPTGR
jgi:hypothetical protein